MVQQDESAGRRRLSLSARTPALSALILPDGDRGEHKKNDSTSHRSGK
jgi:hypothetical protein